jgi:hypothetical protein
MKFQSIMLSQKPVDNYIDLLKKINVCKIKKLKGYFNLNLI